MCLFAVPISPDWNRRLTPHFTFSEMLRLSSCAKDARSESISSPSSESELICSFSNRTSMPRDFKCLTVSRRSTVFLAKRLMDFVRMMLILPASQSASILKNSPRLAVPVPDIPQSAYTPAYSHSGLFWMSAL